MRRTRPVPLFKLWKREAARGLRNTAQDNLAENSHTGAAPARVERKSSWNSIGIDAPGAKPRFAKGSGSRFPHGDAALETLSFGFFYGTLSRADATVNIWYPVERFLTAPRPLPL